MGSVGAGECGQVSRLLVMRASTTVAGFQCVDPWQYPDARWLALFSCLIVYADCNLDLLFWWDLVLCSDLSYCSDYCLDAFYPFDCAGVGYLGLLLVCCVIQLIH